MSDKPKITLTVDRDTLERLKEMARREKRSLSNLANLIIEEWLEKTDDGLRP